MAIAKKAAAKKAGAPAGNKNAVGNAGGKGKRTLYRPEFVHTAEMLALLGATDAQMAEAFSVNESTFHAWKARHIELSQALKSAKLVPDAKVAHSLYQSALGYSHPEDDIRTVSVGDGMSEIVITPTIKHYPPNPTSAIFWLKNRQPKLWRDKVEVESEVNMNMFPPKEELDARYAKALAEAEEAEKKIVAGRMERLGIKPDSVEDQE